MQNINLHLAASVLQPYIYVLFQRLSFQQVVKDYFCDDLNARSYPGCYHGFCTSLLCPYLSICLSIYRLCQSNVEYSPGHGHSKCSYMANLAPVVPTSVNHLSIFCLPLLSPSTWLPFRQLYCPSIVISSSNMTIPIRLFNPNLNIKQDVCDSSMGVNPRAQEDMSPSRLTTCFSVFPDFILCMSKSG